MSLAATDASIEPSDLAERLARGERITVLDVREGPEWGIEAPSVTARQLAPRAVLDDPLAAARELSGPVAVVCARGRTAQPVAQALRQCGVDASYLEGGMRAWIGVLQARPIELSISGLAVRQVQRPGRGCLSYLLAASGRALVVDPAPDAEFYERLAGQLGARVSDVLDTHLHADHLSGARALCDRSGATLRLPALSLARGVRYAERVEPLRDGDQLTLGPTVLRALSLPGHTTDMTGLLVGDRALIGGDSLFLDAVARPDLEQGDPADARAMARILHRTLRERVLALDDRVLLLPGHAQPGVRSDPVAAPLGELRAAVAELAIADADEFANAVLSNMGPRPANYQAIIAVNAGAQELDPELETGGNSCAA